MIKMSSQRARKWTVVVKYIIHLLSPDKSRYFAQPRPIIVNCSMYMYTCKRVLLQNRYDILLAQVSLDPALFDRPNRSYKRTLT